MAETSVHEGGSLSGDRQKRLIVVVDGESAHLYYTSMLLQRLDYNIHTVKTAEDALETVNVSPPALLLTEISLIGMDGAELLKKIKRSPQTFSVPVIILTSSKDPAVKETCLREGCTAYFQKPVEPEVLYSAIQKATESKPRQYIRLNSSLNVIVGDGKAAEYAGTGDYITALSENGMYISTAKPMPVGLHIPITIFLEKSKIRVEGMVLYSFQRGDGPLKTPGMGIKFSRIGPEDQSLIKSFIRREITKGLPMADAGRAIF